MTLSKRIAIVTIGMAFVYSAFVPAQDNQVANEPATSSKAPTVLPASDPNNEGGWVLREDISDEFEGDKIDSSKWFVEGENGDYYIWKGRAPSQFAAQNVIVEDGKLKIRSQWEPDFEFAKDEGHEGNTYRTHDGKDIPVTTGGVISRKRFLNGYMEVKSKAGDAAMTAAFWAIGYESELDIYEQMGNPNAGNDIKENTVKMSVHDWQPPAKRPTRKFGYKKQLPYRVADDFHVYGCEWGEDYLKCYIDGELVYETTQEKEDLRELPVDFEIEYIRVWQKPQSNLLQRAAFGFEGPFLYQDQPRPLDQVPESSENNKYQKFWQIDESSAKHFAIVRHEKFASGTRSLKFVADGELSADTVSLQGPEGSVKLEDGVYELSMRVWVDPKTTVKRLQVSLQDPAVELPAIDLRSCAKGEWVTVTQSFSLNTASGDNDRMTISINNSDVPAGSQLIYFDAISVSRLEDSNSTGK